MSAQATLVMHPEHPPEPSEELCFVYFGNDWFAENRTSSHHLARCLSERYPLLYVETPGFRAPKATGRDVMKILKKLALAFKKPRRFSERMWHVTLPQVPFHRWSWARRLNLIAGSLVLRRKMRQVGFRSPILWFATPHVQHLAGRLGEKLVVYYCIDDYAALPDIDKAAIGRMDRELCQRADQLFVSSRKLFDLKKEYNPTTVFSPHGVDVALFEKASDRTLPVALEVRELPHPVIGFFGLVEAWFDVEMLAEVAKSRPNWTFLLIGRVAVNIDVLTALPNVRMVGAQRYEALPDWARAFDVAIIPFRRNELVMSVNPLKLREYLATGKPVVSTCMPEVERFSNCVGIANDPKTFEKEIEKALSQQSPEEERARMRAVAGMTWEARMEEALSTVRQRLREKAGDIR